MAARQPPRPELRVSPADLFLLDRWDRASPLAPDEQRDALYTEYVRKGAELHYSYYVQLQQRLQHPYHASSLPEADQALLASVRSSAERNAGELRWLRTCYFDKDGNTTDLAHEDLFKQSGISATPDFLDGSLFLFDDVNRYNYTPGEWQQIFSRIPQLVDAPLSPEQLEKRKAEALQEAQDMEQAESSDSEDGTDWEILYSGFHWASVIGVIWVADQEALSSGEVLIAWYDDCGRTVRSSRMPPKYIQGIVGMLQSGAGCELGQWQNASIGADYDLGGAFGPPESGQ